MNTTQRYNTEDYNLNKLPGNIKDIWTWTAIVFYLLDSVGIKPHEFVALAYSTVQCGRVGHVLMVSS
jgi:hypothetical protein